MLADFKWSPFNDQIIATGSVDSSVKLWVVPEDGIVGKNITEAELTIKGHEKKIVTVDFHPTAQDVLISSSGDNLVKFWDLQLNQEKLQLTDHTNTVDTITWDYTGTTMASSCRDKKMRLFDVREKKQIKEGEPHGSAKRFHILWLGNTPKIFSVGLIKRMNVKLNYLILVRILIRPMLKK